MKTVLFVLLGILGVGLLFLGPFLFHDKVVICAITMIFALVIIFVTISRLTKEQSKQIQQRLSDEAKDENLLLCPVDGSTMEKLILSEVEILVDHCPECGGYWFDKSEKAKFEIELQRSSQVVNFSTGMIAGTNIGRSM